MKPSLVVGGVVGVVVALLGVLFAVSQGPQGRGQRASTHVIRPKSGSDPLPHQLLGQQANARELAAEINHAQEVIDDPASPSGDLADAGRLEQLATAAMARETRRARDATLGFLRPQAAAAMRTDLAASAALSRLAVPRKRFPPWRIVQPTAPGTLLSDFREGQARFGVGWEYLATIEFIETRFGRVHGTSSAGAQGPMQFLPSTWARYGKGSIDNQRDAIIGAARFLAANGAPRDMGKALYRYNNSTDYAAAVQAYAGRMRADPRAYDGYYNWQVLYAKAGGVFILPVGYPRVRPSRVQYP